MKNSVIDTFLNNLKHHVDADGNVYHFDKHVMLYGSGMFASGGRGEWSVPLKYIKKRCGYFFECHMSMNSGHHRFVPIAILVDYWEWRKIFLIKHEE